MIRATIEKVAGNFMKAMEAMIDHCLSAEAGGYTPSDFPMANLDQRTIDLLFEGETGIEDVYPLSPMPEGMLFHSLIDADLEFYDKSERNDYTLDSVATFYEQVAWRFNSPVDGNALKEAFGHVMERHSILRTSFRWRHLDKPRQVVYRKLDVPWTVLDWSEEPMEGLDERETRFVREDRERSLAPDHVPLWRCTFIKLPQGASEFVLFYHHALMDGWSRSNLFAEVFELFEAISRKWARAQKRSRRVPRIHSVAAKAGYQPGQIFLDRNPAWFQGSHPHYAPV